MGGGLDLEKFFDTVNQDKLVEILVRKIKDGRVVSLIRKYLNAGMMVGDTFQKSEMGVPQGGSLFPQQVEEHSQNQETADLYVEKGINMC